MTKGTTVVGVRVGPGELARLDALAKQRSCSRSEAVRLVLDYGLPLASHGFKVDLTRLLFILEHLGASIDVIMAREHADIYPRLEGLVNKRMEQFHA
jgi:hypothetical protein